MPFTITTELTLVAIGRLRILETVTTITSQLTGDSLCIAEIKILR